MDSQDQKIIQEEVERFASTYDRIREALSKTTKALDQDEALARELTAQKVAEIRDEEKQALTSDESVAHGLTKLRIQESTNLSELSKQPYFARVVYNEKGRDIEFKLGIGSFPEQRIIDWRKAPISTLYYHYEEGDEYDDEIAGVERYGHIKLKRGYKGRSRNLHQIEHKNWSFILHKGQWQKNKKFSNAPFSLEDKQKIKELLSQHAEIDPSQFGSDDGYLSQVLSLLTPEQFELISKDVSHPVVIQGSAGTGKTTVALHRLAWLLFEGNSEIQNSQTLVILFHRPLVEYVKNVLPSLGIDGVKITSYLDFARDVIETTTGKKLRMARTPTPGAVQAYKALGHTLDQFKRFVKSDGSADAQKLLWKFFAMEAANQESPKARNYLEWQVEQEVLDIFDLSFLLHALHLNSPSLRSTKYPTRLEHLVIDEAQDFTLSEIESMTSFLADRNQLTIAGDLGQKIQSERHFGDWKELLAHLGFDQTEALNLSVAFRSTYQVYKLAEYVRDPNIQEDSLQLVPKFGPEPTWTKAHNFEESAFLVKNWIEDQLNLNQNLKGAVLCRNEKEANQLFRYLMRNQTAGIHFSDARHFKFTPGVTITAIKNVKGLEFHSICLFNPSDKNYDVYSQRDRNLLYVGITRALYRVDLIGYDTLTPMIPSSLDQRDLTLLEEEEGPQGASPALFDDPVALSKDDDFDEID